MKWSIIVLFLFCSFGAHLCEDSVNDEVEPVHGTDASGTHSGRMMNYDDFMGSLDGYPDYNYNNNYDWGK